MIDLIIKFSLKHRFAVLLAACALIGIGLYSANRLPMDALPDITSLQLEINSPASALAPEEVEKQITVPIERAMAGVSGLQQMRSLSKFGLSQVTLIFGNVQDIYPLRQLINERLQSILDQLPVGTQPIVQPATSGLGEIFYYQVEYKSDAPKKMDRRHQLMQLKELQDWFIAPLIKEVAGVAEVSTTGGFEKQILVQPDPEKLRSIGASLDDLANVVRENTENTGGGVFQQAGQQVIIRAVGRVRTSEEIGNLPLKYDASPHPILVKDVSTVSIGSLPRSGAALVNGEEAVIGAVTMLRGENTRTVAQQVSEKLKVIQGQLPEDVEVHELYNRSEIVNHTIRTVEENLFMGAVLVVAVLFAFLGNVRAALIVASAIPLALLFTLTGLVQFHITGNLMSLGAIDFGLIVDGAVVMTDNILRHLSLKQTKTGRSLSRAERISTILTACHEVSHPMVFGVGIIALVYLPILTLTGIEGKMFRPMAAAVMMALIGALFLALTVIPVLCTYVLTGRIEERENRLMSFTKQRYTALLSWAFEHVKVLIGLSMLLIVLAAVVFSRLGAEFVPSLDEGSYLLVFQRPSSIGLDPALAMQSQSEKILRDQFPEVERAFSRVGADDKAVDPVGLNQADTYLSFAPQKAWRKIDGRTISKEQLADLISNVLAEKVPGQSTAFSQPIEDRFNDFLEGARADVVLEIYGGDFNTLEKLGSQVQALLKAVPGAADVTFESFGRAPMLEITPKRDVLLKYDLQAADIGRMVASGLGSVKLGTVIEGDRPIEIMLRLPAEIRKDLDQIRALPIRLSDGGFIEMGQIAQCTVTDSVNEIHRDAGRRRASVLVNLRGRDLSSFVREAQQKIKSEVKLPEGYTLEFGGQFKNLKSARMRLMIVVPLAFVLILLLIHSAFGSWRQALLICTTIPLAMTGGVFALASRGLPFSLSAAIGFIALSGIAVLNGIVLMSCFNQLSGKGTLRRGVLEGALIRLRPVLMTALVASLGFIPMALATGVGAEVQRPLATVVIGGIISCTFLTLILLPVLYCRLRLSDAFSQEAS